MINKVILVGNLGRDPETRYSSDGNTAITNLNIATNRRHRNAEGQTVTDTEWHRVVMFSRLAEIAKEYLRKGSMVYIEGRLQTRQYEAKDGSGTRYTTEIVAEQMQMLGNRTGASHEGGDDGFESAPRARPQAAPRQAAPAPQAQPAVTAAPIDALGEDVPF